MEEVGIATVNAYVLWLWCLIIIQFFSSKVPWQSIAFLKTISKIPHWSQTSRKPRIEVLHKFGTWNISNEITTLYTFKGNFITPRILIGLFLFVWTSQWWRDLFRCRIDLLNFSMGFNIVAPYMEFLHLNWYIAEWSSRFCFTLLILPWATVLTCHPQELQDVCSSSPFKI